MKEVAGVYRGRELAEVTRRWAEGLRRWQLQSEQVRRSPLAALLAERRARSAAGAVAAVGGVATLAIGAASWAAEGLQRWSVIALWTSVVAAVITYLMVIAAAPARLTHHLARASGDPERDLARLQDAQPADLVLEVARQLGLASIARPLVGIALLGPLTLHLVPAAVFSLFAAGADTLEGLATWVNLSAAVVPHAHIVLAVLSVLFARRVARGEVDKTAKSGARALALTVLAAALPGALLLLLPPLITAVTGAALVFPAFAWAAKTWRSEAALLDRWPARARA
jgi:hypothetical protein